MRHFSVLALLVASLATAGDPPPGAGERVLFNGKDLIGWKLRPGKDVEKRSKWSVVEGVTLEDKMPGRLAGNPTGCFQHRKRSRRGSAFVGDAPTCEARYPSFCSGALVPCKKSVLISSMASMERVKDIRSVVESSIRDRTTHNSHRAEL